MYLQKDSVTPTLARLVNFENKLESLFCDFNLDLRENTGRRNMLLSQAQEVFFAEAISSNGYNVSCSGKTGEPDIVIECIGKELECKLTSSGNRSWPLQCDYTTISKKGSLDFLYVLSNKDFSEFAVLLFENLTAKDFHLPAPGSRQKSRMNKANAMKKCIVLHGDVNNKSQRHISKYIDDLSEETMGNKSRISELTRRLENTKSEKKRLSILKMIKNEKFRFEKKKSKLCEKIKYWTDSGPHFEISLDAIA